MISVDDILVRTIQIILVPSYNPDVIWSIAPLFFGLIMMQMYFGKYKTEQLGWNTAYGNSVSLVWACFVLFRYMYVTYGFEKAWNTAGLRGQFYLIVGIAFLTFLLIVFNYRHSLPKQLAFFLSNSIPTTVLAYLGIVIVMGRIPVDLVTAISGFIILIVLEIVFRLYRKAITSPYYVQRTLEIKEKKKQKEKAKFKRKIKGKIKKIIPLGEEKPKKKAKKRKKKKK